MTVKPAALGSALALILGLAAGGVASQLLLRMPSEAAAEQPAAELA